MIASLELFMLYLWNIQQNVSSEITLLFPISTWATLLFLSRPLLVLVPFMTLFMVCGAYFISRQWGSEIVIIATNGETKGAANHNKKVKYLSDRERALFKITVDTEEEVYQNDLPQKSGLEKYQVSRILLRFESLGIIRKERHGMTNQIFLTFSHPDID